MIHIDSLILEKFYRENKSFFENARVQKIQQPTRRDIVLHLRNNGESRKLYVNINPSFYHVCFMSKENEKRRDINIPKQPPMFCMLLRKHMEGARILKINKPQNERILELIFENYNELGDRIEECLSIELMGKHSNIVLYNTDNNIILGCAHNIGEEKSKERELAGGLPYIYPPKQDKKILLQTRYDWFVSALKKSNFPVKKAIADRYFSLSQFFVEELCTLKNIDPLKIASELSEDEMQILFVTLHEFFDKFENLDDVEFSVSDDYESYSCLTQLTRKYDSVNELIDDYFAFHVEKTILSSLKSSMNAKILKSLKKLKNTYENQIKQLDKREKAELYMLKGNLLTANSYAIRQGEKVVSLEDYCSGKTIEIQLDENKTPIENAQRYFNLYTKTKKACQVAEELSEKTKQEIDYLEELLYDIDVTDYVDDLKEMNEEFDIFESDSSSKSGNNVKPNKFSKKTSGVQVEKISVEGITVYIGKNSRQNDYLYSKVSSPNDVWFHVLNTPGSHIIAKLESGNLNIPDSALLKIAKLAKEYSTAKNSSKVSVVYTLRKYVKRPQNTKSGFVVYKNETEIVVE